MRITHEADYAIRILYTLAKGKERCVGASVLAKESGITQRFALKILRKLMLGGVVASYKGVSGGYALAREPKDISLGEVVELIDGPITVNHCLSDKFSCTRVSEKDSCAFHRVFCDLNQKFRKELYQTTFDMFL